MKKKNPKCVASGKRRCRPVCARCAGSARRKYVPVTVRPCPTCRPPRRPDRLMDRALKLRVHEQELLVAPDRHPHLRARFQAARLRPRGASTIWKKIDRSISRASAVRTARAEGCYPADVTRNPCYKPARMLARSAGGGTQIRDIIDGRLATMVDCKIDNVGPPPSRVCCVDRAHAPAEHAAEHHQHLQRLSRRHRLRWMVA